MTRRALAAGLLFAAGALTDTLVTGCQGGVSAGPPGSPANSVAPPVESDTTSPSGPAGQTTTATPASPVAPTATPQCNATSLKLALGPANGAAGKVLQHP